MVGVQTRTPTTPEEQTMTSPQNLGESDWRIALADEYTQEAQFNLDESMKIRGWRDKLVAKIAGQANRAYETRPTTIHDPKSIQWALSQDHPKLNEYGAGLQITERRAALYASMATDLRLQVLTELLIAQQGPPRG